MWPRGSSSNTAGGPLISRSDSRVTVYVVPTDEELMIARHTLGLLSGAGEQRLKTARTA